MSSPIRWNDRLNQVHDSTTKEMASRWVNKPYTIEFVNCGLGLSYKVQTLTDAYYLKIIHLDCIPEAMLSASMTFHRYLFEQNIPVSEPLFSRDGLLIEGFNQGDDFFSASMTRAIPGQHINFNLNQPKLYQHWGRALGQLHRAGQSYPQTHYTYPPWEQKLQRLLPDATREADVFQKVMINITRSLTKKVRTCTNFGLIHGDHRTENVIANGLEVNLIDFDRPIQGWYLEDLFGPFLNAIIYKQTDWLDKLKPYIEGYLSIVPEILAEFSLLSTHIKLTCVETYLFFKYKWNSEARINHTYYHIPSHLDRLYHVITDEKSLEILSNQLKLDLL